MSGVFMYKVCELCYVLSGINFYNHHTSLAKSPCFIGVIKYQDKFWRHVMMDISLLTDLSLAYKRQVLVSGLFGLDFDKVYQSDCNSCDTEEASYMRHDTNGLSPGWPGATPDNSFTATINQIPGQIGLIPAPPGLPPTWRSHNFLTNCFKFELVLFWNRNVRI